MEFTINENPDSVLAAIYAEKADVAAFSCYIWNIGQVRRIAENLKKIQPDIVTVLGGPEVSYDPVDLLYEFPYIDFVISGEGEKPFPILLECIFCRDSECSIPSNKLSASVESDGSIGENIKGIGSSWGYRTSLTGDRRTDFAKPALDKLKGIAGLTYRAGDAVESNPMDLPPDLTDIPSPYSKEMLASIKDKIAYFEASRGCPFSCSYCLSSAAEGVRFFPLERVKEELTAVINAGVRQVKFVDRTFNCNKARAKELLRFISELQAADEKDRKDSESELPNFHFEAAADLFDNELINILTEMPKGLIQLEIGIQTVNTETLEAVKRKTDIGKVFENINKILQAGNIHLHLDLIAGLPYEDLQSFKESFNSVYSLKPHTLQLGFLKLLKGSPIRGDSSRHAYVYRDYAPYEVLANKYISYSELTLLKGIEEILDRYWNSGRFTISLGYIIYNYFSSAFDFYLGFYRYILKMNKNIQSVSGRDSFSLLLDYAKSVEGIDLALFKEYLKLDFLASDSSGHLPAGFDRILPNGFNDKCHEFLRDQSNLSAYFPAFAGLPAKQIMKNVHFEQISINEYEKSINNVDKSFPVYLFDYTSKDSVTGRFKYYIVDGLRF